MPLRLFILYLPPKVTFATSLGVVGARGGELWQENGRKTGSAAAAAVGEREETREQGRLETGDGKDQMPSSLSPVDWPGGESFCAMLLTLSTLLRSLRGSQRKFVWIEEKKMSVSINQNDPVTKLSKTHTVGDQSLLNPFLILVFKTC